MRAVEVKASPAAGFRRTGRARVVAALAAALTMLAACNREQTSPPPGPPAPSHLPPASPPSARAGSVGCTAPQMAAAAGANATTLTTLPWAPFRRPETGWETYAPLIQQEIGSPCEPRTEGFAARLAAWQAGQGLAANGLVDAATFTQMKGRWQEARPFVMINVRGVCPEPPDAAELAVATPEESYGGKIIQARAAALAAYRRMAAAARAEVPEIAADPRNLTIFSGFRSPEADAERCAREGNCNGVVRATCSPHRTGLAFDLYLGAAPGFGPDSSADPNRLYQTKTAAYGWLVANARRFGFANYPFEPWHWEWTGEDP